MLKKRAWIDESSCKTVVHSAINSKLLGKIVRTEKTDSKCERIQSRVSKRRRLLGKIDTYSLWALKLRVKMLA